MKTIKYILIAVFISSIFFSAIPISNHSSKQTLTFQCLEENYTQNLMSESTQIITKRFKDYGLNNFDINLDHSFIHISFDSSVDIKSILPLILTQAKIEFYECYKGFEIIENYELAADLYSMLNISECNRNYGILGYCQKEKISLIEQYLKIHYVSKPGMEINFYWSEKPDSAGNFYLYMLHHNAALNSSNISESTIINDELQPSIQIKFNELGKSKWKVLTNRNLGKPIAIVLDKKVLFAPIVHSEINDGKCILSGNFTQNEIKRMNVLLNNGELPLTFKLKE